MSHVLEIEFLCGAHSSGERETEHSSTPAMQQSLEQMCCWSLGSWAAPALLLSLGQYHFLGRWNRAEHCLCSQWLLSGEMQAYNRGEAGPVH